VARYVSARHATFLVFVTLVEIPNRSWARSVGGRLARETEDTVAYEEKVRQLLAEVRSGDGSALENLLEAVGDELRKLSAYRLWRQGYHTLQTSTLVREVVVGLLKIVKKRAHTFPETRQHFLALATKIMICTLADRARKRRETVPLDDELAKPSVAAAIAEDPGPLHSWSRHDLDTMLSIQQALDRIERSDPKYGPRRKAALELRLFGGLKFTAIADELAVSEDIARNDCIAGLAMLRRFLTLDPSPGPRVGE
jgi:DNA-directed RNA polymerase specialized sigma24 family protein